MFGFLDFAYSALCVNEKFLDSINDMSAAYRLETETNNRLIKTCKDALQEATNGFAAYEGRMVRLEQGIDSFRNEQSKVLELLTQLKDGQDQILAEIRQGQLPVGSEIIDASVIDGQIIPHQTGETTEISQPSRDMLTSRTVKEAASKVIQAFKIFQNNQQFIF